MQNNYKIVLSASLKEIKNSTFFYKIEGENNWIQVFKEQKSPYIDFISENNLIYSVPWYFGLKCNICRNDFNGKLFFNINEHEKKLQL